MEREAGSGMANETRQSHGFLRTLIGTPYRRTQFRRLAVGVLAALLIALGSGLGAKERKVSRTVSGLVSDASDNPISGAVVTLTDLSNGKKTATFTGQSGTYHFSNLEPNRDYEVQATFKDDASRVRKVSSIDPRNRIVLNLRVPAEKEGE